MSLTKFPTSPKTKNAKIILVILCGGSGTRLWPLSDDKTPKQLLPLIDKNILLHDTLKRAIDCTDCAPHDIITITTKSIASDIVEQLEIFHPDCTTHVLVEPCSKNTAAAIAYASLYAKDKFGEDALLWIIPADHYVQDNETLKKLLMNAKNKMLENAILTFGITPTSPETGYGYIKVSHDENPIKKIENFTEKPALTLAQDYIATGDYFWNSGMFLATAKTLINEYIEHAFEIISPLHNGFKENIALEETYKSLPHSPFDQAIMEKTNHAYMLECAIGWSDVGTWQSVWHAKTKDINGNATHGLTALHDTQNCIIHSNSLLIATLGLKDIAIVEHKNSILIADKNNSHAMLHLSDAILKHKDPQTKTWGTEKILSNQDNVQVMEVSISAFQKNNFKNTGMVSLSILSGSITIKFKAKEIRLNATENCLIPFNTDYSLENNADITAKILMTNFSHKPEVKSENLAS